MDQTPRRASHRVVIFFGIIWDFLRLFFTNDSVEKECSDDNLCPTCRMQILLKGDPRV
jgi:hypothetical protein